MSHQPASEERVYVAGPRGAVVPILLTVVGVTFLVAVCIFSVGSGPIDYQFALVVVGGVFLIFVVSSLWPFSSLGRLRLVLRPAGIGPEKHIIAWAQVQSIEPVFTIAGHRISIGLRSLPSFTAVAPASLWWRSDERFQHETADLRAYATAHGAVLEPRPARLLSRQTVVGLVVMPVLVILLVLLAGWRIADRGWISPWTPVATYIPTACRALDGAGLDRIWPPSQRESQDRDFRDAGGLSACQWSVRSEAEDSRYSYVMASYYSPPVGLPVWSSTATAIMNYNSSCAIKVPVEPAIGDSACFNGSGSAAEIVVRKADVLVRVSVTRSDLTSGQTDAVRLATALARQISVG
jgi:hypothetical protein